MSELKEITQQELNEATIREIKAIEEAIDNEKKKIQTLKEFVEFDNKLLYEDDVITVEVVFNTIYGLKIYVENQENSHYDYYNLFGSHSWFQEWVQKLFEASELLDFANYQERFKALKNEHTEEAFQKLTVVVDELSKLIDICRDSCVNFFKYISAEIKEKTPCYLEA